VVKAVAVVSIVEMVRESKNQLRDATVRRPTGAKAARAARKTASTALQTGKRKRNTHPFNRSHIILIHRTNRLLVTSLPAGKRATRARQKKRPTPSLLQRAFWRGDFLLRPAPESAGRQQGADICARRSDGGRRDGRR